MSEPLVIVDLDTGSDDALALLILLAADAAKKIRLIGVTCVSGNTSLNHVCLNTLRILSATNRLDIPVFSGAQRPLVEERVDAGYHGSDGFGDIIHSSVADHVLIQHLQKENAIVALHRLVTEHRGRVTLICLAPLTNIALTMRSFPDFEHAIKGIHIMGGNVRAIGNITSHSEFNFYADPEAAHIVLEAAKCPVQITPWETCMSQPFSWDWRMQVLGKHQSPAMDLINKVEEAIRNRSNRPHWVCCDQFAVSAFIWPDIILETHKCLASVELHGKCTRGQMVQLRVSNEQQRMVVITKVDSEKMKDNLIWTAKNWTKP